MDSSACGHLSVHQPRSEQSEGQSTGAPRAQLPLSLGDITASQCRSHFKLISLCTMFFKSFLNKTEIQCLFPGVWEQRPGHMCTPKKLWGERCALGVHFCSCLVHLLTINPPPPPPPPPRNLRSVGWSLWQSFPGDRAQGAMAWDSCSWVPVRETGIQQHQDPGPARPRLVLALLLQEIYAWTELRGGLGMSWFRGCRGRGHVWS